MSHLDTSRYQKVINIISQHGPLRICEIARQANIGWFEVLRVVTAAENRGDLLCEDDYGRISVYSPQAWG